MMSSAYYAAKIQEMKAAKAAISGLLPYLTDCATEVKTGEEIVIDLIICGERMDKKKLTNIKGSLVDIAGDFAAIMAECDEKIAYYEELYRQALAAEEEAARQAAAAAAQTKA